MNELDLGAIYAENRMSKHTVANTSQQVYLYDAEGRRVVHQELKWTGSAWSTQRWTVYAYDASGQLGAEVYYTAPEEGAPCTTCYLTADMLGSTRLMTDQAGNSVARYDYLPFGEEISSSRGGRDSVKCGPLPITESSPKCHSTGDFVSQRFTGKERDAETGLDYFGARYHSSPQGRFISSDPLMASAIVFDPQTWNRYAYGRNNPLRFIDPNGMVAISAEDCQKDQRCVNVNVNVIYDRNANGGEGLTDKQKAKFESSLLANARDEYGDSNVRLDVSYSEGRVIGTDVVRMVKGALNVIVSDSNITLGKGVSLETSGGYAFAAINIDRADGNTLTHEFAHHFMGDTVGILNSMSRLDPTGIVNIFANTYTDARNDIERFRAREGAAYRVNSFLGRL